MKYKEKLIQSIKATWLYKIYKWIVRGLSNEKANQDNARNNNYD